MTLAWAGAGLLMLPLGAGVQDDLLYDQVAQRWLDNNGAGAAKSVPELLESRFAHLALGVFDVYLPTSTAADTRALKDTGIALQALIDLQQAWNAWVTGQSLPKRKEDALGKWLRTLAPKAFAGHDMAGADFSVAAGASDEVLAQLEQYKISQRKGGPLGSSHELGPVPLVIFPKRGEFVELVCVAGALDERARASAWSEGITTWLEYTAGETRLVALEYSATGSSRDFDRGIAVGAAKPAALSELVAQVGSRTLLQHMYTDSLDPALISGMANALVIELYGELDTRIDGDVRSRSSQGRSVFVPGGNPNGGYLPPTSAENRWRGTKGKDHFAGILAQVQKQSGKKTGARADKLAHFVLQSDDGSTKEDMSAPFLGPNAVRPPDTVFPDYLELVRCYSVAFLHWLRAEASGKDSNARFAQLLKSLDGAKSEELPAKLQEVYGQPLSSESADGLFAEPTLEGRFLSWLAR